MKPFSIRVLLIVTLGLFFRVTLSPAFEYNEDSSLFVDRARYNTSRTYHIYNNISKRTDSKNFFTVLLGQNALVTLHDTWIVIVNKENKPFFTTSLYSCFNKAPPFKS